LSLRNGYLLLVRWILWGSSGLHFNYLERLLRDSLFLESSTAEHDDGRSDPLFTLDQLGFQEFESNADGTEFFPLEKVCVAMSWNVG
jgi:hypothetical protein